MRISISVSKQALNAELNDYTHSDAYANANADANVRSSCAVSTVALASSAMHAAQISVRP